MPVIARSPIAIRVAVPGDLAFIDDLQKKHSKMVGFAKTAELQGHIEQGTALIAEEGNEPRPSGSGAGDEEPVGVEDRAQNPLPYGRGSLRPIGYCLYRDRYFKREDCGIVSQLNVLPGSQRGLVGAALIKAMFERVPWGVRLFCCWCAQDLEANHFWEALGFVPLAFRAGSRGKEHGGRSKETRLHIFWQRRVREGDDYPYWYPSQTSHGRLNEARLALPIPPGRHWYDELPFVLPAVPLGSSPLPAGSGSGVRAGSEATSTRAHPRPIPGALPEGEGLKNSRSRMPKSKPVAPRRPSQGLWFAPPPPPEMKPEKPKRPKRERQKNDPKFIAAAREVRDRYLEEVNAGRLLPAAHGKYDVSRPPPPELPAASAELKRVPLLAVA